MKSIYRMNSSRLNERNPSENTEKVARHLITTNEGIVQLLMNYKCFLVQFEVGKKEQHPPYIEKLLKECKYFICEKEPGGFLTFLSLIEEQRRFALQHIQRDVVIYNQYKSKLVRNTEHDELYDLGTSKGLDRMMKWFSITETERQALKGL